MFPQESVPHTVFLAAEDCKQPTTEFYKGVKHDCTHMYNSNAHAEGLIILSEKNQIDQIPDIPHDFWSSQELVNIYFTLLIMLSCVRAAQKSLEIS